MTKRQSRKTEPDWKEIALLFARKITFALNHLAPRNGSGGGLVVNLKTMKTRHWRDDFADALEKVPGWIADREAIHAMGLPRKERQKFFAEREKRSQMAPKTKPVSSSESIRVPSVGSEAEVRAGNGEGKEGA